MLGAQLAFGHAAPPEISEEHAASQRASREVARNSGLAASVVPCKLTMLELKGLVRDVNRMRYVRLREELTNYDQISEATQLGTTGERGLN